MYWWFLIIGGLFEVGFATCLGKARESTGSEAVLWLTGFFICLALSMYFLFKGSQGIPIGTAYAVWTGIGACGIVIMGLLLFHEPATFWRLFFLSTLIISIIGLKMVSGS